MTRLPSDASNDDGWLAHAVSTPWFSDDAEGMAFVETRGFTPDQERILLGDAGGLTRAGMDIGPDSALRVSTAYACRRVIAEGIAKMPLRVVRRERDARGTRTTVQYDHPVHALLNGMPVSLSDGGHNHVVAGGPNDWMTPFEFMEYMVGVALFHGQSFALIQRDTAGRITELLPLLPGTVSTEVDATWQVQYRVSGYGENLVLAPGEVLIVSALKRDPWRGVSAIDIGREALGLAAAMEAAQARFHANDLRPSGVLSTTRAINPEIREKIRQAWASAYGPGGQGGVAILDEDFKFSTITAEAAKSEMLESRKLQVAEVCRFFGVFPIVIGHNDGSQNFASVEAMFTAHKEQTLHPWVARIEQSMSKALLTPVELARGLFIDIDMDATLRGTLTERMNNYEKGSKICYTPNEIREREGLDRIDDPEMDRVQLQRNNTGTSPLMARPDPAAAPVAMPKPGAPAKALPKPAPANDDSEDL